LNEHNRSISIAVGNHSENQRTERRPNDLNLSLQIVLFTRSITINQ
jgi:hypothetical protein